MSTSESDAGARAQQALDQLKQAIEENPDAVRQAATDAIASLRATVADLTVREKAELAANLRDLQTRVSESDLKQQLEALASQLNQSA
jgi:hypothetical protein